MRAAAFSTLGKKTLDIRSFLGEHFGKLSDGQIVNSNNVTVLSGGALYSMLAERKIDIAASSNSLADGVYSLCEEHDAEYETYVTPEWVYKNICPKDVLAYEDWQLAAARIFVENIGEYGKNDAGYRRVLGAFSDGTNTFVFYESCYKIIDERRSYEHTRLPKGYIVQFNSGEYDGDTGSICIYALSQVFLDVIDSYGNVTTTLVDASLILHKKITAAKYLKSTLISTDGKTYKYATLDYAPHLGESYTINFDRVYTDIYQTLGDYASVYVSYRCPKRMVRYCNMKDGEAPFGTSGEKMLVLPDMRLLSESGTWSLSSESADMPTLYAAVQYFDRLFGINGDTVYASAMGACTDFTESLDESASGSWRMVTSDIGGFTAICSFGGKVVVFTEQSMMTVRGNELPFTLSFVGEHGCVSQDALAALDGALYFVSREGVMCYNGSSVKKISDALPRGTDYSAAALTAENGTLVLSVCDGYLWFYEPSSGEWSRRRFDVGELSFVSGMVIAKANGGSLPYMLFDELGDFSFDIALANGGRRRIKSISVTASVGIDSELALIDENGNTLMCIYDTDNEVVTRTFLPRAFYIDHGKISFEGRGECVLYSLRIEYAPLACISKRKG